MPTTQPRPASSTTLTKAYDYARFSQLTGKFNNVHDTAYRVKYRRLMGLRDSFKALLLMLLNLGFEIGFLIWLFQPEHITFSETNMLANVGILAILAGIVIVESFRLLNIYTLCHAALVAKDPIPVRPMPNKRVAFATTIVPSKEPFSMVHNTLEKMLEVRYDGKIDVWLLDEGNDPEIKKACAEMGVYHFSRKGVEKWNQPSGMFRAKTKHGNHNAWLSKYGDYYDFVMTVDSDHAPLPNFAERMLGYFRDPDVAFVVGPQVYGNYDHPVTKGAESQAYIFQATIQRAANAYNAAMFVGTNHAYRITTWDKIMGFQDSITEDLLTSLVVHTARNPQTGRYWKSVYTPDVVAIGQGPESWTDFFSQQLRWARGANEVFLKYFLKFFIKLPFRKKLHYLSIITFYPTVALSWIIGIFMSMLYLVMGQTGIDLAGEVWLALYLDIVLVQLIVYTWLRKYNVSPHEAPGTMGFPGILFSILALPVYVTAWHTALLGRKAKFVVTPKGNSTSPDTWLTFKKHLLWGALVLEFLAYSIISGTSHVGVQVWSVLTLMVCLAPIFMWRKIIWPETTARFKRMFAWKKLAAAKQGEA